MTGTDPASRPKRALVVEDEPHIRELVVLHLGLDGMATAEAATGEDALRLAAAEAFDLVILDLMLPRADGMAVCRAMRSQGGPNHDVPILMLTARREESDKVLGLESGADDYLTKPFGVRELVARARALLRRPRAGAPRLDNHAAPILAGRLRLDPAKRQAVVGDDIVDLTPHEFDVLYLIASHPGIVFTREMLLERVWSNDVHVTERSVDTLVKRIRQKIEMDTREPQFILTVWGTGYKFAETAGG